MQPKSRAFHFRGYWYDEKKRTVSFSYAISFANREPLTFTEKIILPRAPKKLPESTVKKFLEPLHLMLGISYYKLYCPPKMSLPFALSPDQAEFWNTVYRKGLGEFLYRNKLRPDQIAKFPHAKVRRETPASFPRSEKMLLGIGGGKDSIVAAELLRSFDVTSFAVETQRKDAVVSDVIRKIGNPSLHIQRKLDPQIFAAHPGSYNGHIPISAIYAFLGLFSAALYGYRYIVVGNEQSANFGNMRYRGMEINHQWSKSSEFESMLQEYTRKYITADISYFSLLRQFYEIRIAEMFAKHGKYHYLFSSCNIGFKIAREKNGKRWCGECPKCAFVFLILAPFLPKEKVIGIFKKNLLDDPKLLPLYKNTLGFGTFKPFDCVGTFEEAQVALAMASKKFKDTLIVKTFLPKIKHREKLIETVFRTTHAPTLPTPFRFLGIKNIYVLGYGTEGKETKRYLKKKYPGIRIGIGDEKLDRRYLEKQADYDLIIKTPGIPKERVTGAYTTATNIFFSQNKNFTIGVTGTKGKSTTVSLIYAMLEAAGKKTKLIGNIGNPMLVSLAQKNDPKNIFVIELSSYMLDDIEYSPNIALLLNLFPDHMTYHGSLEKYYAAKQNIFKYQGPKDIALRAPFTERIPLKISEIPLLGQHNIYNIRAAIHVVRHLGVSDSAIRSAIKKFKPLPHRLENIGTFKKITFYDDAISTTPDSTIMAIRTLKKVDTILLGGEDRGYDFKALEKTLRSYKIRNIVLFPDTGKRMLKSRKGFTLLQTKSMEEAVTFAFKHTRAGSICLLSTASPSYSLWKNFIAKGNEFKKFARSLGSR